MLMKICKFCNAENEDDALFCGNCGERIDGKVKCPKCGEYNDEGETYCSNCGARIDGKVVCECGALVSGNFCTKCGKPAKKVTYKPCTSKRSPVTTDAAPSAWRNILRLVGGSVASFGAFIALIFVFLIAFRSNVNGSKQEGYNIYYYIGKIYKDISTQFSALESYNGGFATATYVKAALSTVTAIGTLVTVPVFAIMTIAGFVKSVTNKQYKLNVYAASLTSLFYFAGCLLMLGLNGLSVSVSTAKTVMPECNAATKFGLYFSFACIAAGVLSTIVADAEIESIAGSILKYVTAVVLTGLAVATFITAGRTYIEMKEPSSGSALRSSILTLAAMMLSALDYNHDAFTNPDEYAVLNCGIIYSTVAIAAVALICILIAKVLSRGGDSSVSEIVFAAIVSAMTLVMLILAVIATDKLIATVEGSGDSAEIVCGNAIAAFVTSILALGVTIARKIALKSVAKQ